MKNTTKNTTKTTTKSFFFWFWFHWLALKSCQLNYGISSISSILSSSLGSIFISIRDTLENIGSILSSSLG